MSELNEHVETILDETFKVIDAVYSNHREDIVFHPCKKSRLIFPRYSLKHKNDTEREAESRISEQELRFAFVEQFNALCDNNKWPYYYSVETPTDNRYVVSKAEEPEVAKTGEGTSGAFDLAIHDEGGKRICWIEFKALMKPEKEFSKDLLKLNIEANKGLGYFVHLLENAEDATFKSIRRDKVKNLNDVIYVCHILKGRKTYSIGCTHWNTLPEKSE